MTSIHVNRSISRLGLLLLVFLGAGCDQKVATVNYSQVGACDAGPHKAYVFFEIGEINNVPPSQNFDFIAARVSLDEGLDPRAPWPYYWRLSTEMMVSEDKTVPSHVLVPHGTAKSLQQFMVFQRVTGDPDGSKEANQTAYLLGYVRRDEDPPVLMVKSNAAQTSWRDTNLCSDITAPRQSCMGCHQGAPATGNTMGAVQQAPAATTPLAPAAAQ
ncbi:MAG: hypothetical protein JWM78_2515 [Verrucomicrobiaceae bacterium]|nr:hypothetical protein [Verrucomicrobiaceae bacterium]